MRKIIEAIDGFFGRRRSHKARARCAVNSRRLAIEPLESRTLLAITIAGTIRVVNLPGDASYGAVPIRGAQVVAGGQAVSTDGNGYYAVTVPGTFGPKDSVTLTITAVAKVAGNVAYDVDLVATNGHDIVPAPYISRQTFTVPDGPPQQTYTDDITLDGRDLNSPAGQAAQALAILSVTKTFYDYATRLGATLPQLDIGYPYKEDDSQFRRETGNIMLNPADIFDPRTNLKFAAIIGHEFGHYVAASNGFGMSTESPQDAHHNLVTNQRLLPSQHVLSAGDEQLAFCEAWADYFAVAAAQRQSNLETTSMENLKNGIFFTSSINTDGGYGEDNETSDMRIFWKLANTPNEFCAGGRGLFQFLKDSRYNTLTEFWNALVPSESTPAGAKSVAALGRLFENEKVSASIINTNNDHGVNAQQETFTFNVPDVHGVNGYVNQCTMDYAQVIVYDAGWNIVWSSLVLSLHNQTYFSKADDPQHRYTTFTMNVLEVDGFGWPQILDLTHGTARRWIVEVGAYDGPGQAPVSPLPWYTSGFYCSHAEPFEVAGMAPKQFRSGIQTGGVTSNDPQLVYDIVVPYGQSTATIPAYTASVYASSTGLFDDENMALAESYYFDDTDYLDATTDDYTRTVTLPASELDPDVLAAYLNVPGGGYLLAKIHFDGDTTGAGDIWVRFEGGAVQPAGSWNVVYDLGASSLTDDTPDGSVNRFTVGCSSGTLTVSTQGGSPWDPINATQTFSGDEPPVDVLAHGGDNTVNGTGLDGSGNLTMYAGDGDNTVLAGDGEIYVYAGDGNNTIDDTAADPQAWSSLNVTAGNGDNKILGGPCIDRITLGNGNNTIYLAAALDGRGEGGTGVAWAGNGDNTFIVNADTAGLTSLGGGSGNNTLDLVYTTGTPPANLAPVLPTGELHFASGRDIAYDNITAVSYDVSFNSGGTVDLPAMPAGTNVTVSNGTTLDLGTSTVLLGTVTLDGGSITDGSITADAYCLQNGTISANLGGDGGVTIDGGAADTIVLSGENTYAGLTEIDGGTLQLGASDALPADASVSMSSTSAATLDLNGFQATIGSLWGGGPAAGGITLGGGLLTIDGAAESWFDGPISDTGSGGLAVQGDADTTLTGSIASIGEAAGPWITKSGSSTLVLAGDNSYAGETDVIAGVLQVQSATALGATGDVGKTIVDAGAALELDMPDGATVAEPLVIHGTGPDGQGAIRNISGDNTLSGQIIVGASALVQSDSGVLTISGDIVSNYNNSDRSLTVREKCAGRRTRHAIVFRCRGESDVVLSAA